jgi:WD40 repeat protein
MIVDTDSRRIAAQTWDLRTAKAGSLRVFPSSTRELAPSWDGLSIAVRSSRKKDVIAITDLATGTDRAEIPWPKDRRDSDWFADVLAFAPDDKQLLVAVSKGAVLLDIATGKERGRLEGHAGELTAFAFSPDGKVIATADNRGLIRTWDADTLRARSKPVGHRSAVTGAERAPDGKLLLTWAPPDETVFVWDLASGTPLRGFSTFFGTSVVPPTPVLTPDGLSVVLNTKDRLLARDIQTGLERPLPGAMAKLPPGGAVFAPDGTAVLTYSLARDAITVWDWPGGKKRFTLNCPLIGTPARETCFVRYPGFSADGKVVFPAAAEVDRWDATTGKQLPAAWEARGLSWNVAGLRVAPELVFSQDGPGSFLLRETGSGVDRPRFRCRNLGDPLLRFASIGPAVSPDGHLIVDRAPDGGVRLFEPATAGVRRELVASVGFERVLGFTPDGTKLLTSNDDHSVLVWDVRLQTVPLPEAFKKETDAAKLWVQLITGKSDVAYLAMARLAREPAAAVKMARLRLAPVVPPGEPALARILEDLGDPAFSVREKAAKELDRYGEIAVGPVRERMSRLVSPEARMRCEAFVKKFTGGGLEATRLADARAIELLEALDTHESRAFLKELAGGHGDAFRTQEARWALERNKP